MHSRGGSIVSEQTTYHMFSIQFISGVMLGLELIDGGIVLDLLIVRFVYMKGCSNE